MKQKIYNTIYGAVVADALGVPAEFLPRETLKKMPITDMTGYGTYNLPKGSWSDDSSMTLCLADSIARLGKSITTTSCGIFLYGSKKPNLHLTTKFSTSEELVTQRL